MEYIFLLELIILIIMVLIRSAMLRKNGVNAIVFGVTDKTDFIIVPIVLIYFYTIIAPIFNLPFPTIIENHFWNINILIWLAIIICTISLIWFAITLKTFGKSFRIGIDEKTPDELITTGTFAFSRNPIYISFIAFFFGIFLSYPTIVTTLFLIFMIIMIHRQILREEKFLKNHYGKEYEQYTTDIERYI